MRRRQLAAEHGQHPGPGGAPVQLEPDHARRSPRSPPRGRTRPRPGSRRRCARPAGACPTEARFCCTISTVAPITIASPTSTPAALSGGSRSSRTRMPLALPVSCTWKRPGSRPEDGVAPGRQRVVQLHVRVAAPADGHLAPLGQRDGHEGVGRHDQQVIAPSRGAACLPALLYQRDLGLHGGLARLAQAYRPMRKPRRGNSAQHAQVRIASSRDLHGSDGSGSALEREMPGQAVAGRPARGPPLRQRLQGQRRPGVAREPGDAQPRRRSRGPAGSGSAGAGRRVMSVGGTATSSACSAAGGGGPQHVRRRQRLVQLGQQIGQAVGPPGSSARWATANTDGRRWARRHSSSTSAENSERRPQPPQLAARRAAAPDHQRRYPRPAAAHPAGSRRALRAPGETSRRKVPPRCPDPRPPGCRAGS